MDLNKYFKFLSKNSLLVSISIISILTILFYPKTYVSIDEHDYLYNSINVVEGNLKQKCKTSESSQFEVEDYCIYKYNIGTSFFYLPAVVINANLSFLCTFIVFIFGIYIFNKLLVLQNIDPIFTYLFAFYPAFIYFSRTLFSETYSATLILAIFYYLQRYLKGKNAFWGLLSGGLIGLSVIVRYTNIIPLGIVLGCMYLQRVSISIRSIDYKQIFQMIIKELKFFSPVIIGGVPFLIFFLYFNNYLYGNPLRSGYYYSGEESLYLLSNIPKLIFKYLSVLLILYPGMIIFSFKSKVKYKLVLLIASFITILFYSSFPGNNNAFEGRILDLIFGVRFLIPVIPLLILLYVDYLNSFLKVKHFKGILLLIMFMLIITSFFLSFYHQNFLSSFPPL